MQGYEEKRDKFQFPRVVKVYISSPYTAATEAEVDNNIAHARMIAIWLWNERFVVLCPHLNTAHFETLVTRDVIMDGDLALLENMDAMFLAGNWQNSLGCQLEVALAKEKGIPMFETVEELKQWRNNQAHSETSSKTKT